MYILYLFCDISSNRFIMGFVPSKIKENELEFSLYAVSIETSIQKCHRDAPLFWKGPRIYRTIIINGNYELEELPDIEEYLEDGTFKLYIPIK